MQVKRVLGAVSSAILVLLAVACGGDDDDDAQSQFVHDYCELQTATCCQQSGKTYDAQACETLLLFGSPSGFDRSAGDHCIAALRAANPSPTFCTDHGGKTVSDACDTVFPRNGGSVAPGGACTSETQCAPVANGEAQCVFASDDFNSDARICQAQIRGAEGVDCDGERASSGFETTTTYTSHAPQINVCWDDDNLYCSATTKTCTARGQIGGACNSADYNSCPADAYCAPKDEGADAEYVCKALGKEGEACTPYYRATCGKGLYCHPTQKTCTAVTPAGAACSDQTGECGADAFCQEGTCSGSSGFGLLLFCK